MAPDQSARQDQSALATLWLHGILKSKIVGTGQFTGGIGPQEDALGLLSHLLLWAERGWSEPQSSCCLAGAVSEGHAALQERSRSQINSTSPTPI